MVTLPTFLALRWRKIVPTGWFMLVPTATRTLGVLSTYLTVQQRKRLRPPVARVTLSFFPRHSLPSKPAPNFFRTTPQKTLSIDRHERIFGGKSIFLTALRRKRLLPLSSRMHHIVKCKCAAEVYTSFFMVLYAICKDAMSALNLRYSHNLMADFIMAFIITLAI